MRKTLFLLAVTSLAPLALQAQAPTARATQIGRASCRERV